MLKTLVKDVSYKSTYCIEVLNWDLLCGANITLHYVQDTVRSSHIESAKSGAFRKSSDKLRDVYQKFFSLVRRLL